MFEREAFLDSDGKPLTQSLFLEIGYSDKAIYTLKEQDHEYNGKTYIAIKQRYIEMNDPTEYQFATTYFMNWKHWQRICENKVLRKHIDEWREELEIKLRSEATKKMIDSAASGNYQATKWLADRGWDVRGAGRPTKLEKEKNARINEHINDEYGGDVIRLLSK